MGYQEEEGLAVGEAETTETATTTETAGTAETATTTATQAFWSQ